MKFTCRKQINAPVILILTHILISGTWAWNEYGAMQKKGNKNEKFVSHREIITSIFWLICQALKIKWTTVGGLKM